MIKKDIHIVVQYKFLKDKLTTYRNPQNIIEQYNTFNLYSSNILLEMVDNKRRKDKKKQIIDFPRAHYWPFSKHDSGEY